MEDKYDIKQVKFGLLNAEEIRKMSVVEITESKFVPKDRQTNSDGRILYRPNSVYDVRMGPMNPTDVCPTCHKISRKCQGHFGHINLAVPIIHPLYYKRVLGFLQCTCIQCGKLLFSRDHLHLWNLARYKRETRFNHLLKRVGKGHICIHCNLLQPTIQFNTNDNEYVVVYTDNDTLTRVPLRNEEIKNTFQKLTQDDLDILGFGDTGMHPRNLILEALPVIPPRARPFIMADSIHDDDLTTFLTDIVKTNTSLKDPDIKEARRQKLVQNLNFLIRSMMDNSKGASKRQNGTAMKGIKERLEGKGGLFRNNIQGRRQNYSARTVIGPDPTLRVNEVAIPPKIARELCYPERVTEWNIEHLRRLMEEGRVQSVLRDNKRYFVEYSKKMILQIGDIVERHLMDGDWTIVNRQPTLWKGGMMAMKVRVREGKTIRLSLAVTNSFNADFDGDEMNLFPCMSEQSRTELSILSSVQNHLVTAQASRTNITIVQDSLLGSYLMTKTDEPIPKDVFLQMLTAILDVPFESLVEKIEHTHTIFQQKAPHLLKYCGKALFSLLLPNDFIYYQSGVCIYAGVLYEGQIKKAHLGKGHQTITRILAKEYDDDTAITFVNNVQFLANAFLLYHGFSVGISDCLTTHDHEIKTIIARSMIEAENAGSDTIDETIREARISRALGRARDIGMRLAKNSLDKNNRFLDTITAGSKGDFFNIAQIGGLLGQQNVKGGRIQPSIGKCSRTLPHQPFHPTPQEDYEAKGFIRNSFIHGLRPQEFWAHATSGREGVLDTALKTANSGYIQRKMIKILEDMNVKYDNTVRNSVGTIIQFSYGTDGFDGSKTIVKNGETMFCDIQRIADRLNLQVESKN